MSIFPQQVFLTLICWCLWERTFSERGSLPLMATEYLGRLNNCRCVPRNHLCTEEVVAISFLAAYTHSVKVCVQGTRLCCQESASPKAGTRQPNEDLYFLLLKLPSVRHRGDHPHLPSLLTELSRHTTSIQNEIGDGNGYEGDVSQQDVEGTVYPGDEGGSLWKKTDDVTRSTSTTVPGDFPVLEWNETNTGWTEKTNSSTEIAEDPILKPDTNQTDESPFTFAAKLNESGGENYSVNAWSASDILSEPPSDPPECFTDTCYKNATVVSVLSTVDADAAMNVSADLKDSKIPTQTTKSLFSTENKTTEHPATQDHVTQSSRKQDSTTQPITSRSFAGIMTATSLFSPSPAPATATIPSPVTSTTDSPGFWMWLFG